MNMNVTIVNGIQIINNDNTNIEEIIDEIYAAIHHAAYGHGSYDNDININANVIFQTGDESDAMGVYCYAIDANQVDFMGNASARDDAVVCIVFGDASLTFHDGWFQVS